jgi:HSP20 family protein
MAEKTKEKGPEGRAVAPWWPFREFEPWPSLLEGLLSHRGGRLFDEVSRDWPRRGGVVPAMEITEADAQYTISVELPGVRKEDVHVELDGGELTIRGEKKSEREEKKERSRYVERSYGSFSRSFTLPANADAARLAASFKDGVLSISIPKSEESKPRAVAIKSE